jgi:pimeloyl-ACP methyl ester carboxylesterase
VDFDYGVMPAIILAVGILIIWLCVRRIVSLSTKTYARGWKVAQRILLSVTVLVTAAVAGSSLYNAIALHHFWTLHPHPGVIVDAGGYKMHIDCTGSGSPAIILETGLGNDSLIWGGVQPELSKTTRVCSYDRAGFGWSDARPDPRDAGHIAEELNHLLVRAGITGPIVLMAHSIGGLYVRDYATHYPNVVGLVFVDSSTPFQDRKVGTWRRQGPPLWVFRLAFIVGVPRLMGRCSSGAKGADAEIKRLQAEATCRTHASAVSGEGNSIEQSSQQTVHSGPYGALPILIISHDPSNLLPNQTRTRPDSDWEAAWNQMQEDFKLLSTRSRRIIARGSRHAIMLDRPDLIEKEVPLFIEQIRGTAPQPTNYGSTVTE